MLIKQLTTRQLHNYVDKLFLDLVKTQQIKRNGTFWQSIRARRDISKINKMFYIIQQELDNREPL